MTTLTDRLEKLEPRERAILYLLAGTAFAFVLVLIPLLLGRLVSSVEEENDELREVIQLVRDKRVEVASKTAELNTIKTRYAKKTPPLATLLDGLARANGIEIPESQDRAMIPHGKHYEEQSTKISLNKVGMLNLAKFLEAVETSGYPVSVSRLNIRKRADQPDSYDVQLVVSAFERKSDAGKSSPGGAP